MMNDMLAPWINDMTAQHVFDPNVLRKLKAEAIILHQLPISIVNAELYGSYLTTLNPLWQPLSVQTMRDEILKVYAAFVKKIQSRIAITTDVWICDNQYYKFMAITAYFIEDSWILQSWILRYNVYSFH